MLFAGGDVMADDFIQIPSFLADDVTTESIVQPMATGCTDWCEHYDECCNYENCMGCQGSCLGSCETCQDCQGTCQDCQTTCQKSCQGCQTCQSGQAPSNPAENAIISVTEVSYTHFTIVLSGLNNPTGIPLNIYFYLDNVLQRIEVTASSPTLEHYYTQLNDGTTYTAKVVIENISTGQIYKTLTRNVTTNEHTLPKLPTPTLDTNATVKTGNSITITINPVTGADTYYARIGGGTAQTSSGRTFTFYDLTPNTQYYIEIKVGGSGYRDSNWAGYYATTLLGELWEWHYPKTSGSGFNVTPAEWLAFCNKINEVRVAKGLSAYSFTTSATYIDKDKPFYAWIFLEAVNAINDIGSEISTELLGIKSGDDIYAWYFDNLKNALNSAIQSI